MSSWGRSSGRVRSKQRGSVTVEFAALLPVVLIGVVLLAWCGAVVVAQLRCIDAARDTARELARGEPAAAAIATGRRTAPQGAELTVHWDGEDAVVRIGHRVPAPGGLLPAVEVGGQARVRAEPGAGPPR